MKQIKNKINPIKKQYKNLFLSLILIKYNIFIKDKDIKKDTNLIQFCNDKRKQSMEIIADFYTKEFFSDAEKLNIKKNKKI